MPRPRGAKQTPETIEKIRRANKARWADPAYRAEHLPKLLAAQPLGTRASAAARALPPMGVTKRRLYVKVRSILGPEAARATL